MREKVIFRHSATVFTASVFGEPRHTFEQHMATGQQTDQQRSTIDLLAHDALRHFAG